jgi:hypothetical protein
LSEANAEPYWHAIREAIYNQPISADWYPVVQVGDVLKVPDGSGEQFVVKMIFTAGSSNKANKSRDNEQSGTVENSSSRRRAARDRRTILHEEGNAEEAGEEGVVVNSGSSNGRTRGREEGRDDEEGPLVNSDEWNVSFDARTTLSVSEAQQRLLEQEVEEEQEREEVAVSVRRRITRDNGRTPSPKAVPSDGGNGGAGVHLLGAAVTPPTSNRRIGGDGSPPPPLVQRGTHGDSPPLTESKGDMKGEGGSDDRDNNANNGTRVELQMCSGTLLSTGTVVTYPLELVLEENNKVEVYCNDCEVKSISPFHFLGLECGACHGFNTTKI